MLFRAERFPEEEGGGCTLTVSKNGYYERNIHLGKLRKPRNASKLRLLKLVHVYLKALRDVPVPDRHTLHIHHRRNFRFD